MWGNESVQVEPSAVGARSRWRRTVRRRLLPIGSVALVVVAGSLWAANATTPVTTIYACKVNSTGSIRIVSATATCTAYETKIQWNVTGPAGPTGATGPAGAAGPSGLTNYQLAQQDGYTGTLSQWLASLVGPPGPAGPETTRTFYAQTADDANAPFDRTFQIGSLPVELKCANGFPSVSVGSNDPGMAVVGADAVGNIIGNQVGGGVGVFFSSQPRQMYTFQAADDQGTAVTATVSAAAGSGAVACKIVATVSVSSPVQ